MNEMTYADANTSEMTQDELAHYKELLRKLAAAEVGKDEIQSPEKYEATHGLSPDPNKTVGKLSEQKRNGTISPEDSKNFDYILPKDDNHAPIPVSKALSGGESKSEKRSEMPYPSIVSPEDKALKSQLLTQLQQKMLEQDRGSDYEMGTETPSGSEYDASNRGNSLADLLNTSAAQIGVINGKMADTSPLYKQSKDLREISNHREGMDEKQADDRRQLQEYLMAKIEGLHGGLEKKDLADAELQARGIDKSNDRANRNEEAANQREFLAGMEKAKAADARALRAQIDAAAAERQGKHDEAVKGMNADKLKSKGTAVGKGHLDPTLSYDDRLRNLKGTDKTRFDNTRMWLENMLRMEAALKNSDARYSLFGDNNYTEALRNAAESFGRVQSGGAINKGEEDRFMAMMRSAGDSPEKQYDKLRHSMSEAESRLKTLGFSPDEIPTVVKERENTYGTKAKPRPGMLGEAIGTLGFKAPESINKIGTHRKQPPKGKGPVEVQNGITYHWNYDTGDYE